MSRLTKLSGTTALMTLMMGSTAFADVSAQEVWSDWQSYMSGFGYDITSSEATSGNTLTVSDLTMNMVLPENAGTLSLNMGQLNFTDQGDGTVAVTLPASQLMKVMVDPAGEAPVDVALDYTNDGLSMIVSGSANDMTYTYSANAIGIALSKLVVEGETIPVGAAEMAIKDVAGSSSMKMGNLRDIMQKMTAGSVTYNIDVANPDNADEFLKLKGALGSLMFDGTMSIPNGDFDVENMANMLNAGFAVDGKYSYTGGNMDFQFVERGDAVNVKTSSASGSFDVGMSRDSLKYIIGSKGLTVNMMGGDIPFPVQAAMGEALFKLVMPISKSDDSQDFALGVTLADFTTSDMIWGMLDPTGQLPRDPATVAFDVSGKGKLGFDMMDPDQMAAVERGEMGIPGQVDSLDINNIEISAAGASLTGNGGAVIDFQNAMMSGGMKGTDGELNLRLAGANGLAAKLVEMGLLPQDQVMGMQMMLGMFAQPAGDDVYESKLEIKKDGAILANGQRLQ